jgi:hypothetical protein
MVRAVVNHSLTKAAVARRFNTTVKTVAKWIRRFNAKTLVVARFIARPPHRSVRAAFAHTACTGLSLSHHAIFVVLCDSIFLFDPRREHSSIPTAYCRRRRAAAAVKDGASSAPPKACPSATWRIKRSRAPNPVCPFSFWSFAHAAGRNSTSSGTSPVVTKRHSAISSLLRSTPPRGTKLAWKCCPVARSGSQQSSGSSAHPAVI